MALENLSCPQFVDFTTDDAFNIHDGADFCFGKLLACVGQGWMTRPDGQYLLFSEKGVVGELDLGGFGMEISKPQEQEEERRDSGEMERLIAVLKSKFEDDSTMTSRVQWSAELDVLFQTLPTWHVTEARKLPSRWFSARPNCPLALNWTPSPMSQRPRTWTVKIRRTACRERPPSPWR